MDISSLTNQMTSSRLSSGNLNKSLGSADSVDSSRKNREEKALKEACQGFEAIFINTMLKSMRSTIPEDGLFEKSQGMDIYTSMHDQYLAEKISCGENSTGIGEYLYQQMHRSL